MPTWDELLSLTDKFNPLHLLEQNIAALNKLTKRTTICYMSAFTIIKPPVPPIFHSIIDQDIQGFMTCTQGVQKDSLDLIIHTPGGDYEATKRIINYLHEIYKHIRVFVPHMAMSGGTLIACAADEIYMGPYSSLGPTDPQVLLRDSYVPIGAIISEFVRAFEEVSAQPSKALLWNERLKQIPFGMYTAIETMRNNALKYLIDLLKKRNCRNQLEGKITKIAKFLNAHEDHTSHGRGIGLEEALQQGLNVKDLRKEPDLEDAVLSTYHSATILFAKTPVQKFIINHLGRKFIVQH